MPYNMGNLSNLRTLSLQGLDALDVEGLEWLSGISQLKYLEMNSVNLSKENNWLQVINTLTSLLELNFQECSLSYSAPLSKVNFSYLAVLDLSYNKLRYFPRWISQLNQITYLDLSYNNFEGDIPSTSNTTKLQHIDMSFNNFNSTIPEWFYNCKTLEYVNMKSNNMLHGSVLNSVGNLTILSHLDLSNNKLSGYIPSELANLCGMRSLILTRNNLRGDILNMFGNMSNCFLGSLKKLDLSQNQLFGHLTDQFGEFKSLQILNLGQNSLVGSIPKRLGNLPSLTELRLSANRFTGNLPESLGRLSNLKIFLVDYNMLEGIVSEIHFANLRKLSSFFASGNRLILEVKPNWTPPFKLKDLGLGSWNLGGDGQIPRWLETQKGHISELDLSNTGLISIPKWIWEMNFLNLSHNQLHGMMPNIIGQDGFQSIYLNSNRFNGSLPEIGSMVSVLDLSNNLFSGGISKFLCDVTNETYELSFLHLGGNRLSGELPDCWMRWSSLIYLNLGNNILSGSIPNSIGLLTSLRSLNLQNNNLSGEIPSSMQQLHEELMIIDLAGNKFAGNLPSWIGMSLANLRILVLRSNKFTGNISPNLCHLNSLQILDLSDNIISGVIPMCVHNFTAMAVKQLSREGYSFNFIGMGVFVESASIITKGSEIHYNRILYLVTSINLSGNNLSGNIPEQLTSLVGLRSLNLSRNHLTGLIPDAIGNMKHLESIDLSRNSLSGEIPNSLGDISFLSYLDVSYNNLTGSIPQSTQLIGLNASDFIGNNLCGPPLPTICNNDGETPAPRNKENDGVGKSNVDWFYIFMSLGYGVGISAFFATLILNKSMRDVYFGSLENMWNKFVK